MGHKLFVSVDVGRGRIVRSSKSSTVTLPAQSWLRIQNNLLDPNYCGCGLPSHLLLPKGTAQGRVYDLFVMLTSGEEDAVVDPEAERPEACQNAPVWCNNYPKLYPDGKPMGYPFDRRPYSVTEGNSTRPVADLEEFMAGVGNMRAVQVSNA
jgi:tyrosinase